MTWYRGVILVVLILTVLNSWCVIWSPTFQIVMSIVLCLPWCIYWVRVLMSIVSILDICSSFCSPFGGYDEYIFARQLPKGLLWRSRKAEFHEGQTSQISGHYEVCLVVNFRGSGSVKYAQVGIDTRLTEMSTYLALGLSFLFAFLLNAIVSSEHETGWTRLLDEPSSYVTWIFLT